MVSHDPAVKRHLAAVEIPAERSWALRYGVAVVATAGAALVGIYFRQDMYGPLLLCLTTAVTITVWFGGWKPGLLSMAISIALAIYTFHPHFGLATAAARMNVFRLAAFVLASAVICRMNAVLRRAQDEVRYSQGHLAGVVQISEDAIISVDERQRIRLFNRGAEEIFGYKHDEILGEPLALLLPKKYVEAHRHQVNTFAASPDSLRKMNDRNTIYGRRKDGDEFPCEASISKFEVAGEKMLTVRLRDITERVRTENVLRLNEKLAATGRLAATIAHEINNPLESVTNLIFLLQNHGGLDDTARQYVNTAASELARVVHIARQTLGFYRDTSSPVPVRISGLLQDVLDLYSRKAANREIRVEPQFEYDAVVEGFPGELRQIFSNLVANAIEAIGRGGKLRIHVHRSRLWRDGREGVRITIADNGPGISCEHRKRIFEPFFTTKSEKGTGLGLWVARGIVQKHGGAIAVHSSTRLGHSGTVFAVFLPAGGHMADRKLKAKAA